MTDWHKLFRTATPYILTSSALVGVGLTAFFTAKGALKAQDILIRNEARHAPFKRQVGLVWREFIPAISVAAVTGASII